MSDTVIQVEHLSKKYIIGHQQEGRGGHKTLRDAMVNGAETIRSRLLKPAKGKMSNPTSEEFWALKDVSFEIKQGNPVGIIGRNGAGKSTLLKILSRITEPTTGRISINGRVASLLEVGTGFHPELTGRENIYLNGAVLGMSKAEIRKKFDEIVAFAEVEKFLDTPVKRYSSGMYVRLAFAVAAHLEPEILIVDEVLAVGDAQFQKKCLGKMQDVSKQGGRTVLFVSHSMDAIQRLCSQCIMLGHGQLVAQGNTPNVVVQYLSNNSYKASPNQWIDVANVSRSGGTGEAKFVAIQYSSLNEAATFQPYPNGPLELLLAIESNSPQSVPSLGVTIYNLSGIKLLNADIVSLGQVIVLQKGRNMVKLRIEELHLNPGVYVVGLWLSQLVYCSGQQALDYVEAACEIEVVNLISEQLGVSAFGPVTCQFKFLEVI